MEEKYRVALEIISYAGDAKANFVQAQNAAEVYNFQEADDLIREAEQWMLKAHQCQTDMIQQEASGNPADINIIMIHAQDHLTMAMMAKESAAGFIRIYQKLQALEKQIKTERGEM